MASVWTFEPQIEQIHPEARRKDEEYYPGFQKSSRAANNMRAMRVEDARIKNEEIKEQGIQIEGAGLELLLAIDTIDELEKATALIEAVQLEGGRMSYVIEDVDGSLEDHGSGAD